MGTHVCTHRGSKRDKQAVCLLSPLMSPTTSSGTTARLFSSPPPWHERPARAHGKANPILCFEIPGFNADTNFRHSVSLFNHSLQTKSSTTWIEVLVTSLSPPMNHFSGQRACRCACVRVKLIVVCFLFFLKVNKFLQAFLSSKNKTVVADEKLVTVVSWDKTIRQYFHRNGIATETILFL